MRIKIRKPETVKIRLDLPQALASAVYGWAARRGQTVSTLLLPGVVNYLQWLTQQQVPSSTNRVIKARRCFIPVSDWRRGVRKGPGFWLEMRPLAK